MNNVTISGRLVYHPEPKTTKTGRTYLPLRIAVNRNDSNKTTDFINCRAWSKTADFIAKYFVKGDPIELTGKLETDNYTKQDGSKVSETYVLVIEANFTLSKTGKTEAPEVPEDAPAKAAPEDPTAGLPFEI